MYTQKKSLEIKVSFSEEEIEILEKLLTSRRETRSLREVLEEKLIECQLKLIHDARILVNEACPQCRSLNSKEDYTRPPTLAKGGQFVIFRQCCDCKTKFSIFFMPSFEVDYSI